MKIINVSYVSKADLLNIKQGETVGFKVPDLKRVRSARVQAYQAKWLNEAEYETSLDKDEKTIYFKRIR